MAKIRLSRIKSSAFKISSYVGPSVDTASAQTSLVGWRDVQAICPLIWEYHVPLSQSFS